MGGKAEPVGPHYSGVRSNLGGGMKFFTAFTYYLLGEYVHDLMVVEANLHATPDVIFANCWRTRARMQKWLG